MTFFPPATSASRSCAAQRAAGNFHLQFRFLQSSRRLRRQEIERGFCGREGEGFQRNRALARVSDSPVLPSSPSAAQVPGERRQLDAPGGLVPGLPVPEAVPPNGRATPGSRFRATEGGKRFVSTKPESASQPSFCRPTASRSRAAAPRARLRGARTLRCHRGEGSLCLGRNPTPVFRQAGRSSVAV